MIDSEANKASLKPPVAFISYARGDKLLFKKVIKLHEELQHMGVVSILDETDNQAGENISRFCSEAPHRADWLLCVCTPDYFSKTAANSSAWLREEFAAILARKKDLPSGRLIPLHFGGDIARSVPLAVKSENLVDFSDEADFSASLKKLQERFFGKAVTESESKSKAEGSTVTILVADVDGFSDMSDSEEKHVMSGIWPALNRLRKKFSKQKWDAEFPILDGFGLLWEKQVKYREIVQIAEEILPLISRTNGKPALRLGLHRGYVYSSEISEGKRHYWGAGINDAGRACGLGDAGHIVLTEAFWINADKEEDSWNEIAIVNPPGHLPPSKVFSRGDLGSVRFYFGHTGICPVSSRMFYRDQADSLMESCLIRIVMEFAEDLTFHHGIHMGGKKARITLWAPEKRGARELWSKKRIGIDWTTDGKEAKIVDAIQSNSSYSIAGNGRGLPGMAWLRRSQMAVVVNELPTYEESPEEYLQGLAQFELQAEDVENFTEKSSFMGSCAFPITSNSSAEALGVVCIDFRDGFDGLAELDLADLLFEIIESHSASLTTAWKFRT